MGFTLFFFGGMKVSAQGAYVPDESLSMKAFEEKVRLAKDEIWVVDFWASWCRPCLETIPEMMEIHSQFLGKPVRFISISWDKDQRAWRAMMAKAQMPWQQILIPNIQNVAFLDKYFSHKSIPAIFVVGTDGKIKKAEDTIKLDRLLKKMLSE